MRKVKDYILKKLGITALRKECAELAKANEKLQAKVVDLEKRCKDVTRLNSKLTKRVDVLERLTYIHHGGVNEPERTPRLIVSATSFPDRIRFVPQVIERFLTQTVRPDKVVLWLSKEQFPNRENDLPEELLEMRSRGLEIGWCDGDIKSYKKIIPALHNYPDDVIVTIDDDLVYQMDFLEKLYDAHLMYPDAIIASRVHQIVTDEDGKIAPYANWKKECVFDKYTAREDWFFTGGAGTLFPPHVFDEEVTNLEAINELCPHADDIWLNVNAAMSNVKIVSTAANSFINAIEGAEVVRLWDINRSQNDVQLKNTVVRYYEKLRGTVYEKI